MILPRPGAERGHFDHGWLDTYHTFSFAEYHDRRWMGFRSLRVINEDRIAAGMGFGTHSHRDMEILTYMLEGELEHRDSMGNGSVISPGRIQRMSAGTGVTHSEFNHSKTRPAHLLQIWVLPERKGLAPGYEEASVDLDAASARPLLLTAPAPDKAAVRIHQDIRISVWAPKAKAGLELSLREGRALWVQVARGSVALNGHLLAPGDGAAAEKESELRLFSEGPAEALLFEMA